jgi:hypothetical protein
MAAHLDDGVLLDVETSAGPCERIGHHVTNITRVLKSAWYDNDRVSFDSLLLRCDPQEGPSPGDQLVIEIRSGEKDLEIGAIFGWEEDEDDGVEEALGGVKDGLEIEERGVSDSVGFWVRGGEQVEKDSQSSPNTDEKKDDRNQSLDREWER